jgi:DNA polymerase III subunit gamma/tau
LPEVNVASTTPSAATTKADSRTEKPVTPPKSFSIKKALSTDRKTEQELIPKIYPTKEDYPNPTGVSYVAENSDPTSISHSDIMNTLEAYAELEFSDKPIYAGLISGAKFTLTADSTIEAKFESKLQIDMFQDIKSDILQYLRDKLGDRQLIFNEVTTGSGDDSDASRPKLYTDEDKLKFLIQKNPLLLSFKQKFNLDFK